MNHLTSAFVSVALLISGNACAQNKDVQTLQKELKVWQPTKIAQENNVITISLNENQVTSQIYHSVISEGVCTGIWLHSVPDNFLKPVKELRVLNKHSYLGYALSNPLTICKEMGAAQDDEAKTILLSSTRIFTDKKS